MSSPFIQPYSKIPQDRLTTRSAMNPLAKSFIPSTSPDTASQPFGGHHRQQTEQKNLYTEIASPASTRKDLARTAVTGPTKYADTHPAPLCTTALPSDRHVLPPSSTQDQPELITSVTQNSTSVSDLDRSGTAVFLQAETCSLAKRTTGVNSQTVLREREFEPLEPHMAYYPAHGYNVVTQRDPATGLCYPDLAQQHLIIGTLEAQSPVGQEEAAERVIQDRSTCPDRLKARSTASEKVLENRSSLHSQMCIPPSFSSASDKHDTLGKIHSLNGSLDGHLLCHPSTAKIDIYLEGKNGPIQSRTQERLMTPTRSAILLQETGGLGTRTSYSESLTSLKDSIANLYGNTPSRPQLASPAPISAAERILSPASSTASSSTTALVLAPIYPNSTPHKVSKEPAASVQVFPIHEDWFTARAQGSKEQNASSPSTKKLPVNLGGLSLSQQQRSGHSLGSKRSRNHPKPVASHNRTGWQDERNMPTGKHEVLPKEAAVTRTMIPPWLKKNQSGTSSKLVDSSEMAAYRVVPGEGTHVSDDSAQPMQMTMLAQLGPWSNSKRWMSREMQDRTTLIRITNNLRHIGADKSSCVPHNLAELTALKAEVREAEKRSLSRVIRKRLTDLENNKKVVNDNGMKIDQPLGGKCFFDGKSAVFASENCFTEHIPRKWDISAGWPSLAELREEGDRRGAYDRYLPIPRLNIFDAQVRTWKNKDLFHPDGTVRWQAKVRNNFPALVLAVSPPAMKPAGGCTRSSILDSRLDRLPEHLKRQMEQLIDEFWDGDDI